MKKFYIITNSVKDPRYLVTEEVSQYLQSRGGECLVHEGMKKKEGKYHYTNPELIPKDTECIIVLGGDGTLLQAARDVVQLDIPLLGINLGSLGFLAEVDKMSICPALDKLLNDDYTVEQRMMLRGKIYRDGKLIGEDYALNDIVISKDGPLRVVRFLNFVNDVYLNAYDADGVIISTPTGSTGYCLSCGGPIVSPAAVMTILTPVAPHTLNSRSVIFPAEDVISVELGRGRHQNVEKGLVYFDGDTCFPIVTGDRIVMERAEVSTRILKLSNISFVEVLRQKMRDN